MFIYDQMDSRHCLFFVFVFLRVPRGLQVLCYGKKCRVLCPFETKQQQKWLFSLTAASPPSDVRGPLCVVFQQSQCQVGNE